MNPTTTPTRFRNGFVDCDPIKLMQVMDQVSVAFDRMNVASRELYDDHDADFGERHRRMNELCAHLEGHSNLAVTETVQTCSICGEKTVVFNLASGTHTHLRGCSSKALRSL